MRATIRERGTVRMALLPIIYIGWAGVAIATAAIITVALSTLVPLLVLAAGFETIFALHVNIERIGRYVQVFHERSDAGWEHVAVSLDRQEPGSPSDPLFARLFILSTSVNFFPAALGGEPWEIGLVAVCHLGFIYRVRKAQSFSTAQRRDDLQRFEDLRGGVEAAGAERAGSPRRPTE